jgi:hypothetical protein
MDTARMYINLFSAASGILERNIQLWLPIIAAAQLSLKNEDEKDMLHSWIDVLEFE